MEPKFQTSFIPKKPITASSNSGFKVVHETNIFSVIATVVVIVTVFAAGGLFAYKRILTNQITEADKNVNEARAAFQPEKIKELISANSRILASNKLLEKHVAVSPMFTLFGEIVVKRMRFTDFVYLVKEDKPTLSIKGDFQTYNALAQQEDIFSKNEFIKNPKIGTFALGDNGFINADFSSTLDPSLISYKKSLDSLSSTQPFTQ